MYPSGLDCSMLAAMSEIKMRQQKFAETQDITKNAFDALQ